MVSHRGDLVQDFLIIVGVGLVNFLFIGKIVDSFIDSYAESLTNTQIRLRIRNVVRPIMSTLIIFGGGALAIHWTNFGIPGIILSFVFYFGLTYFVCMTGRTVTYYQSGGAMIFSMILILVQFTLTTERQPAVAPISPVKPKTNYIYGRFDNDGVFYQLTEDANGRSSPEMLGKLHSVKLYDSGVPEYYLVIDKNGNLHSVKETRWRNTARGKAQERIEDRMWQVFFRTQNDLKKQAKSTSTKPSIYVFWGLIIIFSAGLYFRKDALKVYRRIKERIEKS